MTGDACIARVSNVGIGAVCLLNHRAGETRELCNLTAQNCLAKIEVAEDAIKRIREPERAEKKKSDPWGSIR